MLHTHTHMRVLVHGRVHVPVPMACVCSSAATEARSTAAVAPHAHCCCDALPASGVLLGSYAAASSPVQQGARASMGGAMGCHAHARVHGCVGGSQGCGGGAEA